MADAQAKKILAGLWAESGDRSDPGTGDNPLSRAVGWDAPYSVPGGNELIRRRWNQRFRELDGAASDHLTLSVGPYDSAIDYPQNALVAAGATTYRAIIVNGPTTSNAQAPTDASQTAWETLAGTATAPERPDTPSISASNGVLDVSWLCPLDGGSAISGFTLQWRVAGTADWSSASISHTFRRLTGLDNGVAIEIRVRATNTNGDSQWSLIAVGTPSPDVPDQVVGVVATSGDNRFVDVRWNVPADNGAEIDSYLLQWRSSFQSFSTGREAEVIGTTHTVRSLTNAVQYYFRVRAINAAGRGPWSSQEGGRPAAPPPPPPTIPENTRPDRVPSSPTGTVISTSAVVWEWPIPLAGSGKEQSGGQRITGFEFQWRVSGNQWSGNITTVTGSCIYITGLETGTLYEGRARAVNAIGSGDWSPVGSVRVGVGSVNTFAGTGSGTSVAWTWSAVDGATGYRLETRQGSGNWTGINLGASILSRTTTGHTAGTAVQGRVRAVVGAHVGEWNNATVAIIPSAPGQPEGAVSDRDIAWTWDAPSGTGGSAILDYALRWREVGDEWTTITGITGRTRTITTSGPGRFEAQVRARNAVGSGGWSTNSAQTTVGVDTPGGFGGVGSGTSVAWTWSAVTGATGYRLETRQGEGDWSGSNLNAATLRSTSTGHTAGTAVQGRVRAVSGAITGTYATTSAAIIPGVPTLSVNAGTTSATFSWTAPGNGGSALTAYEFRYRLGTSGSWTTVDRTAAQRNFEVEGAGVIQGEVRARNGIGFGGWSETEAGTVGVPAPASLVGTGSGTSVEWVWSAVTGATGYRLESRQGSGSWTGVNLNASTRRRNTTGHTAGTAVQGRVRAVISTVNGTYRNATAAIVPSAPTLSADGGTNEVEFEWDAPSGTGGSAITGYSFEYREAGQVDWTAVSRSANQRSYTVTANGEVEGRVRAINVAGNGPWSATRSDSGGLSKAGGLSGTGSGTSVSWDWDAVTGATSYRLRTRQGSGSYSDVTTTGTSRSTTGHTAGTAVQGQVRGEATGVQGEYSNAVTVAIIPATPAKPGLVSSAVGMVTVSWSAPANGGSAITGYDVRYRTPGASSWTQVTGRPGTSYTFARTARTEVQVRAVNRVGSGGWSGTSDAVTPIQKLEVTISGESRVTIGDSTTMTANATGGTGSYTYRWSTGATTRSLTRSNFQSSATFTVTVTSGSQTATASHRITATAPPPPAINIQFSSSIGHTEGRTMRIIRILVSASGGYGSGTYTYSWGGAASGTGVRNTITVLPLEDGTFPSVTWRVSVTSTSSDGRKLYASTGRTVG